MARLKELGTEAAKDFPSIIELASIAAMLACGKPVNTQTNFSAANQAIDLWQTCKNERSKRIAQSAMILDWQARARASKSDTKEEIPLPKKYPVSFDEFLRLTIGGKYKARRLKIYRDYVKDMIWLSHVRQLAYPKNPADKISPQEAEQTAKPASLDEIDGWMKHDSARVLVSEDLYRLDARQFLEWRAKQPSERGRKAAGKRWEKERRKDKVLKELVDNFGGAK